MAGDRPHLTSCGEWDDAALTGVLMTKDELQRAHELCEQAGVWLVVDNTYEHFTYDGRQHTCVSGPHVINIFSMSKVRAILEYMIYT